MKRERRFCKARPKRVEFTDGFRISFVSVCGRLLFSSGNARTAWERVTCADCLKKRKVA